MSPVVLNFIYLILGTDVLISAVTIIAFMTLLLLILYLDYELGRVNDKLMKLVALVSSQQYDFDQEKKSESKDDD